MSMHHLRLQSDDNHHDAPSASPAVRMIIMTTHSLQRRLTPHLKCTRVEIERDADNYDDDDGGEIDDKENRKRC